MKKVFFLFAMLAGISASATVTVASISTDYATHQVTFSVSWTGTPVDNRVWVWIDYGPFDEASPTINWSHAGIASATATAGGIDLTSLNGRGFYVTKSPSTITATLKSVPAKFNWCIYGSDAPPKMLSNNSGTLTLGGTPPFVLSDASGANTYSVSGSTVTAQEIFDAGVTPIYITDLTGCTGLLNFGTPVLQGSCTFTQPPVVNNFADFPADYSASTFVSLIDERDWKVYTAVKIGGRWWMGQNLNYQTGLTYWNKHSSPSTVTGSNPALRGGFWCPADNANVTPVSVCDYWGALYPWETAMMLDGKGAWTEVAGCYCTGAANSLPCQINFGRKSSSGTAIGGRGICPPNWHVPTDFEWGQLLDAMESGGGTAHQTESGNNVWVGTDAGTRGKASCSGTSGDTNPVWDSGAGTDVFNFRGIAADDRNGNGTDDGNRGLYVVFWSSATYSDTNAWLLTIFATETRVHRRALERSRGFSVRCVRD
ncbi:MAG: hypothetical protein LBG31_03730 [Prevotellaceae bacterium]|jgi:uncharacterized protein (TIGR02145 family)|nr:hypothetical protein [Prevotellaceae bacterium]